MNAIGILGGTFDPPHHGHISLALAAAREANLEQVILIPAKIPPHKSRPDITEQSLRMEMVKAAIQQHPVLSVSDIELNRKGVSYTIDTLIQLHKIHPGKKLHIIIGADMVMDFGTWRDASRIIELAPPLIAERPGSTLPEDLTTSGIPGITIEETAILQKGRFPMKEQDISSTEIRNAIAGGQKPDNFLPEGVATIVSEHKLYL